MCFRPAAIGAPQPKCPACSKEVTVTPGMTACPHCQHVFTAAEIESFTKSPAPGMPGMPGMPGAPKAPGMPGAPKAPGAPSAPGAPGAPKAPGAK